MTQKQEKAKGGSPFGGGAAWEGTGDGMATVAHGVYHESLPVAGKSVGQIREKYTKRFDIPEGATAVVNGHRVEEDTIIKAGQVVLFARHAGAKG